MELSLHIILQTPPAGVAFGLQEGHGSKFKIVQTQRSTVGDLHFYPAIIIKGDRLKDDMPRFGGPFIQGPYMGNFIYISIGTLAGQFDSPWNRRLKIPMAGITWDIIDQLNAGKKLTLETHVAGTAKDGSPTCATVKPFNGWQTASI
jgi:hypothetical protein